MHGSIGGLSSDVFVERVPSHALDIMLMLSNLSDELACAM